jgi:hypothetical protein
LVAAKPAREESEILPVLPKSANPEVPANPLTDSDASNSVIALAARAVKPETNDTAREVAGLVTVRPKPEKRLNAKDRAKARRTKNEPEAAEGAVAATLEVRGLSTAHPKPEKRKNAKERAKERTKKKDTRNSTDEGGTTPDTTAMAKPKVEAKKLRKPKQSKAGKAA